MSLSSPSLSPSPAAAGLEPSQERLLCHCYRVTESAVRHAIQLFRLTEVHEIMEITQAGAGCRACHCRIGRLIEGRPAECGRLCEILGHCGHSRALASRED